MGLHYKCMSFHLMICISDVPENSRKKKKAQNVMSLRKWNEKGLEWVVGKPKFESRSLTWNASVVWSIGMW